MPTFWIEKTQLGWVITKTWDTKGWIGVPCRIGGPYPSRKAARNVARLLAGREERVKLVTA
jgi:hypothetical protein